jgi:hypothetical protein
MTMLVVKQRNILKFNSKTTKDLLSKYVAIWQFAKDGMKIIQDAILSAAKTVVSLYNL